VHRLLAWVLGLAVIGLFALARRERERTVKIAAFSVLIAMLVQFALGVTTVMLNVPIIWAVVHQAGAFLLLTAVTWLAHEARLFPQLAPRSTIEPRA
jgi:cytochrome c oxidase assembly protein subunit 15